MLKLCKNRELIINVILLLILSSGYAASAWVVYYLYLSDNLWAMSCVASAMFLFFIIILLGIFIPEFKKCNQAQEKDKSAFRYTMAEAEKDYMKKT